jgi:hypothetical protein
VEFDLEGFLLVQKVDVGVFLSIPARFERWVEKIDFGPTIRQEVIDRWKACGFAVYTVNSAEEAALLKSAVRNVEIIAVSEPGRVRISSITQAAKARGHAVTIISNADCIPIEVETVLQLVEKIGPNMLCLGERMNINPRSLAPTGYLCMGFDTFFLGQKALSVVPEQVDWCIGDPMWDYWFPFFLKKMGVTALAANIPVALHLDHPQAWNFKSWHPKFERHFDAIPIGSAVYPSWFNERFRGTVPEKAWFLRRLQLSSALYHCLAEQPKLTRAEAAGSFDALKYAALKANANRNLLSRVVGRAASWLDHGTLGGHR